METTIDRNSYNLAKQEARNNPKLPREEIMKAWDIIFRAFGKDVDNDPNIDVDRIARYWETMFEGEAYNDDQIADMFNTTFDVAEDNDDLVTVLGIDFFSTCLHHAALIYDGVANVGYIPKNGKVIGLSKIARIVQMCAHRFTLQENIGESIAYVIHKITGADDIIVQLSAKHSCITSKPPYAINSVTKTATLKGRFKTNSDLRKEFYSLID